MVEQGFQLVYEVVVLRGQFDRADYYIVGCILPHLCTRVVDAICAASEIKALKYLLVSRIAYAAPLQRSDWPL
jgi:hypothetical protein